MSDAAAHKAELSQLKQEFGVHLSTLRKDLGYSQEDVSRLSRLHRTEIGNLERGRSDPHLSTLLILADALKLSLDRLAEGLPVPQERRPRTDGR